MKAEVSFVPGSATVINELDESYAKWALKRLRVSQPFNYLATTCMRALFKVTGSESELIIKHLHRVGNVRLTLPNGRTLHLWSRADDWVSNQIFWRGWTGYEPETVPLFYRLATRARTTIDVGAYVGFYSLLAGHANPAGQVFAFEPLPEVHERLRRNLVLNGLDNVHCVRSAAGQSDGIAEFFSLPTRMPTSSSLSPELMRSAPELITSSVEVITLDTFVRDNKIPRVDLVKIDTENTEPQVLSGMRTTLERDRPFIICEVLGRGSEGPLEKILRPLGYRYYHLTPDGPVHRDHIQGHPEWLNYLFATVSPEEAVNL
jgi:FkbM family methyltransferase